MIFSFTDAFEHNFEANVRVIASLKSAEQLPPAATMFSHVLTAHKIWILRIIAPDESMLIDPWAKVAPHDYGDNNRQRYDQTLQLLSESRQNELITYTNTKGETYTNTIQDICYHILAHSNYHRGQIAMLLRQHGAEPPVTDYIFFKRQSL